MLANSDKEQMRGDLRFEFGAGRRDPVVSLLAGFLLR